MGQLPSTVLIFELVLQLCVALMTACIPVLWTGLFPSEAGKGMGLAYTVGSSAAAVAKRDEPIMDAAPPEQPAEQPLTASAEPIAGIAGA